MITWTYGREDLLMQSTQLWEILHYEPVFVYRQTGYPVQLSSVCQSNPYRIDGDSLASGGLGLRQSLSGVDVGHAISDHYGHVVHAWPVPVLPCKHLCSHHSQPVCCVGAACGVVDAVDNRHNFWFTLISVEMKLDVNTGAVNHHSNPDTAAIDVSKWNEVFDEVKNQLEVWFCDTSWRIQNKHEVKVISSTF